MSRSRSPSTRSPSPLIIDDQERHHHAMTTSTARCNPFSIDYILSNVAAKQQQQQQQHEPVNATSQAGEQLDRMSHQHQSALVDHLNLLQMNHQRAQLMAHLQTISAAPNPAAGQQHGTISQQAEVLPRILASQTNNCNEAIKAQQANNPNFLYFMACMLVQQQQQQNQQTNLACQQQQQQQQQQQLKLTPSAPQTNTAQGPMDSLALLARLTGSAATQNNASDAMAATKARHLAPHRPALHASPRRQPYPLPTVATHMQLAQLQQAPPPPLPPQTIQQHLLNQHHQSQQQQQQQQTFDLLRYPPLSSPLRAQKAPIPPNHHPHPHHNHNRSSQLAPPHLTSSNNKKLYTSCQQIGGKSAGGYASAAPLIQTAPAPPRGSSTGEKLDNLKPAHSYIGLIGMCILSQPDKRMVLNDIYQYILDHYPYYRNRGSGWRNSVRHNLSLNECFQKAGRAANGKGHYWTIHPANMEDFMNGDFRRRRAQRKVRRWNNMDVPSDESDDESMEDATRPPLPEHFKRSVEMHKQLEAETSFVLLQRDRQQMATAAAPTATKRQDLMAQAAAMAAITAAAAAASSANSNHAAGRQTSAGTTISTSSPPPPSLGTNSQATDLHANQACLQMQRQPAPLFTSGGNH